MGSTMMESPKDVLWFKGGARVGRPCWITGGCGDHKGPHEMGWGGTEGQGSVAGDRMMEAGAGMRGRRGQGVRAASRCWKRKSSP